MSKTIGQLLTKAITLNELKPEVIEMELEFPKGKGIITRLMLDEYYTQNVPIILFINLILSLHIKFDDVFEALMPTFRLVLSKETPETISNKKSVHYELWECEEAVEKYATRLKELLTDWPHVKSIGNTKKQMED